MILTAKEFQCGILLYFTFLSSTFTLLTHNFNFLYMTNLCIGVNICWKEKLYVHHYSLLYAAATILTTCICRLQLLQCYSLSLADPEEELPYHYLLFATPSRKFSILLQNRLQSSDDVNISHRKRPCQYQHPDGSPLSLGHWINQWKLRCDIL